MKIRSFIAFCTIVLLSFYASAQTSDAVTTKFDTIKVATRLLDGERIPWIVLNEIVVFDRRVFKTPLERAKYNRLKYNVYKVLPYARFAGQRYRQLERDLALTKDKRKQRQLVKGCEKEIKDLFNREIKNMTVTQGAILIKLIDRETGTNSYELVKDIKGGMNAFFMQSVAKVFGHNLKNEYDPIEERDIETIIFSAGYYSYN